MAEHIAAGDRAFVDEEYDDALQHYTKSLEAAPSAAAYEARANANIKLERYMEAVQDATKALELDASNAKAYLRKGTACFYLEEYETALQAFERGQQLAASDPKFPKWIRRCKAELDASEGQEVVAPAAAAVPAPAAASPAPAPAAAASPAPPPPAAAAAAPAPPSSSSGRQALAPAAPEGYVGKYRYQWYQLGPKVVLDIYAKNQPKDAVNVCLSGDNDRLRITIAAPPQQQQQQQPAGGEEQQAAAGAQQAAAGAQQEEQEYVLELELFDKVAADVKVEVLKTKVEIALVKANPSSLWKSLERSATGPAAAGVGAAPAGAAAGPAAAATGPPRAYPSSKAGKDWSKVEAEVKEMEEKGELDDADPLGAFFKKIFAQGDEDTRRAMMKSFVESNGTVLSTNWKEVGAKPVECTPPEGMELHKWNES